MSKQTQTMLLIGGALAVAYFLFMRKSGGAGVLDSGVQIAQAQANAQIAQANAAADIAEAESAHWYKGALTGIGEGLGKFIGGL